jgi:hypothetical protein
LYKYDGTTFTLLATDVATPEGITQGTVIDAYFTALAVPPTTMALTDRLAMRVFVTTSGRTLKLHTENSHLSQVITTLSTGVNAINGLTAQVQNFAVGTAGADFGISSVGSTHTFNLPTASAANRGALSSADWSMFNAKKDTFAIRTAIGGFAPADNTTYYFSEQALSNSTNPTLFDGVIPFDCTLIAAVLYSANVLTNATNETSTVNFRVNNTTDTLLSNAVSFGGTAPVANFISVSGLSTTLLAGNTFIIKWTTPTWVTNPTNAQLAVILYFQRT